MEKKVLHVLIIQGEESDSALLLDLDIVTQGQDPEEALERLLLWVRYKMAGDLRFVSSHSPAPRSYWEQFGDPERGYTVYPFREFDLICRLEPQ